MTAAGAPVVRRRPRARPAWPATAFRLLRMELRRNAMPWLVPLLAALFLFDPYRSAMGYPPIWDLQASVIVNKLLPDFELFAGGIAAWVATRDTRRKTTDLVAATARPAWARQGATLAATTGWVVAAYLAFVAVLYGVIAHRVTWGGPPWWPAAVGVVTLAATCAAGFAVGAFFPGRFTAPLTAMGVFLFSVVAFQNSVGARGGAVLLSPSGVVPNNDIGVFYHYPPDLAVAQVMFLGGITMAVVGVLGLPVTAAGPRLRRAAVAATVAGVVAAGTAFGLATTASTGPHGVVIPALHDAASDQPIPYTPVCRQSTVAVCLHPAFRSFLPAASAALGPAFREVAGLPGAPTRAAEAAINGTLAGTGANISGTPPVFHFPMTMAPAPAFGVTSSDFTASMRTLFVTAFISRSGEFVLPSGNPAQQAVEKALLKSIEVKLQSGAGPAGPPQPGSAAARLAQQVSAAAGRFGALPAATRHAWLAAHLGALRAGHITLAQLP